MSSLQNLMLNGTKNALSFMTKMKTVLLFLLTVAIALGNASAQSANDGDANGKPTTPAGEQKPADVGGLVIVPGGPQVPPQKPGTGAPERPPSVGKPTIPAGDLQDLVKRFQLQRRAFLEEQQELRKQLKQGTAAERAAIREQIRERFAEWRDSQRQHVQEVREAAKDIKNNVPSVSDIVDSAKEEGRRGR